MSVVLQSGRGRVLTLLCGLLGKTRQAYYQKLRESEADALCKELVVQEVLRYRERQRAIGGRKLYYLLGGFLHEHGISLGRDGFFDLLREHSLLVRRRRRRPRTTFSLRGGRRYSNLAAELVPYRANQLWVSDITYLRTREDGFCYLSLITDAYSRKIVGYCLSADLTAKGCVAALKMALAGNPDRSDGLIHHSDRGVQYYSHAYLKTLGSKIRISMAEKGDPLENAIAERVNGILKQELLKRQYKGLTHARKEVAIAVGIYNNERPHMSVEMLTPAQAHQRTGPLKRHWKNYFQHNTAETL